jgi:hypothetical protein
MSHREPCLHALQTPLFRSQYKLLYLRYLEVESNVQPSVHPAVDAPVSDSDIFCHVSSRLGVIGNAVRYPVCFFTQDI